MPTFSVNKLSDDEVGAVGEYIRSADGKAARPGAALLKPPPDAQAQPGTGADANGASKAEKRAKAAAPWNRLLAGKWTIRSRQNDTVVTIRQFAVDSDGNGEPEIVLSNAPSDYAVKVTAFELTKKTLKLELTWSWDLNPNYWKTETFDLRLSGNGRRLAGSYALRTSGGQSADSAVWGE